jgi:hypothetical protein
MATPPDFIAGQILTAAQMNQIGLWKIASGSLSLTTSATNVTGVFSGDFTNYRVLFDITARSGTNRIEMRYVVGTTPTSANYNQAGIGSLYVSNTTTFYQRSNNDNQFFFDSSASLTAYSFDIMSPNKAAITKHHGNVTNAFGGTSFSLGGFQASTTDQFTGFQLFTDTGTVSLVYQVFGYKD